MGPMPPPPPKEAYHHGDLRTALVHSALALLEEEGAAALSMRAVARHAGVTAAAPYRHYQDRDALMSAVAAVGYRELAQDLIAVSPAPSTADEIADVAIAYVQFALRRPALFRAMFSEQCDAGSPERVDAVAAGSFRVVLASLGTTGADTLVLNFVVIKSVIT